MVAFPDEHSLPPPIDPDQLVRIEAVHRGFFYQHLFATAMLLGVGRRKGVLITVERDEDIDLREGDAVNYIQVKTRVGHLQRNHIAEALDRFDLLRSAHVSGERTGIARFTIASSVDLGPGLAEEVETNAWPSDVDIVTPSRPSRFGLPEAGSTLASMLEICHRRAAEIPFGGLSPATLVLKLAAHVQYAAAGAGNHAFNAGDMPALLEQLVAQLQDFPEPPSPYRPQRDEPAITTDKRVRLIIGFSGAGKTAWAAEAARHFGAPILYFDVGDLPARAVPTNLAREIVARVMGGQHRGVGGVQLPPSGGIDALRASDQLLRQQGIRATVVLDNVHRLAADDLRQITEAAPNQVFIGLGQPWAERALAEATLGIEVETLRGFGMDAVAAVFRAEGAGLEADTAIDVIRVTGGLPLFVISAARLTARRYGGDAAAFCRSILERTQVQDTAQDLILEAAFGSLSASARDAAALLSGCDIPLSDAEISALLSPLGPTANTAAALRELQRASMLVNFSQAGTGLHDALRPLASGQLATIDQARSDAAYQALLGLLISSLQERQDIPRLTFLVKLLPRVGRTDVLVDLATTEMFYEQGNMAMMRDTLIAASEDPAYSPRDRFWALDALAYWESRDGGTPSPARVEQMAQLVASNAFEARERLNLIFKQLIVAGTAGNRRQIELLMAAGRKLAKDPGEALILRYNRAVALYRVGAYEPVRNALEPIIAEYFQMLGFEERKLIGANGARLRELLADVPDREDIKRLADALNLWATAIVKLGHPPLLRRIQASKLYAVVGAGRSAALAAQDTADEMLEFIRDPAGARETMEQHVLPLIEHYHLVDLKLRARGQYAVILAYCGDFEGSIREVEALASYGGDDERMRELAGQVLLIEQIEDGQVSLSPRRPPPGGMRLIYNPNEIGRRRQGPNENCYCGSGRRFKACHGRR